MPEPKTAAEWAERCQALHNIVGFRHVPYKDDEAWPVLCLACARAYARQQVEADRAQTVEFLEVEARHKDWKPVLAMFKRLIEVIRALPVETP